MLSFYLYVHRQIHKHTQHTQTQTNTNRHKQTQTQTQTHRHTPTHPLQSPRDCKMSLGWHFVAKHGMRDIQGLERTMGRLWHKRASSFVKMPLTPAHCGIRQCHYSSRKGRKASKDSQSKGQKHREDTKSQGFSIFSKPAKLAKQMHHVAGALQVPETWDTSQRR